MSTKNRNIENAYPLAPSQEGLLFHSLYATGEPTGNGAGAGVYVTQVACTLGKLNVAALTQAWQEVMARHSVLRTAFVWQNVKQPLQVVGRQVKMPVEQQDWRGLSPGEQEQRLQEYLHQDRRRGFKLSTAPLMRLALFQVGADLYRFVWSHHHILLDGWSVHLLIHELFTLYQGFCRGETLPLPPTRPYSDYIGWLQQQDLGAAEAFWRQTLAGFTTPTVLNLNGVHHRDGQADGAPRFVRVQLAASTTTALRTLAQAHQLTLNTVVQGALALLLSRYSGEEDLLFGTVVAGRPPELAGVESMAGLFVNTLPVRVRVPATAALLPWLQALQEQQVEMRRYEYSPLVKIQSWSEIPHGRPLFETLFAFENYPVNNPANGAGDDISLEVRDYQVVEQVNYPLTIAAGLGEVLSIKALYDEQRFDEATITRLLGHLRTILENIVADPEQSLAEVNILTAAERRQLLVDWNNTRTPYPHDEPIPVLFERQAARTPDAVAVVFDDKVTRRQGDKVNESHPHPDFGELSRAVTLSPCHPVTLTYRDLNARANQLAHYLRTLGVGVETLVGICMERSVDMVVGILGILKAGGAYVPLDPTYPPERLRFMLEDTQAPVVLTHAALAAWAPDQACRVICLDTDWAQIAGYPSDVGPENQAHCLSGENLAYVMYTSGSTGRPKGIGIPHRAISRLVFHTNYIALGPDERMALISNSAFDAATFELWGALLHGGQLVGVDKETALSPTDLAAHIQSYGITTMFLTTALFNQMAREAPNAFHTMRNVLFGGEAVDVRWVKAVLQHGPPQRLLHVYGPTESTTFATWHLVQEVAEEAKTIPIGRPLANTETYILDRTLQPVPVGVPGELYIGGDGLARGYLNQPVLTAEKFIPNPFLDLTLPDTGTSQTKNEKRKTKNLYKTGDLVRYRPDGSIEFLERLDNMVKIRGFRIELGEIETCLSRHPAVQDVAVLARQDRDGDKRLVAYLVPRAGQTPTAGELRHFLQEQLPAYMAPSAFVLLDAFPLNPNGKVDRKALPAPEQGQAELGQTHTAPRTPTEEVLAGLWANVLGTGTNGPVVGIHDSFFDLGGHSLLATQLISRIRAAFQVELPLRDLFEAPTVALLAERLEAALRTRGGATSLPPAPPITPVERNGRLPLSFGQQRLWFMDQLAPGGSAYNFHVALRLTTPAGAPLNVAAMEQALSEIVRRHEVLRTTFAVDSASNGVRAGEPVQVIQPAMPMTLPVLDLSRATAPEGEAQQLINQEARRPFDLAQGPLLRLTLLRLSEQEHIVVLVMHHIITDGWSSGIFVREFATLYTAFAQQASQPELALPALPIQYADFAHWQRHWMQGDVLQTHVAYWRRQLANAPTLQLPTDHSRPPVQTFRGARTALLLAPDLTAALHTLSRQEGVTLFMTLLAAFQLLLVRASGQDDIVVGADIANRNRGETEHLIGFFANQLVLRTDLAGDPTFRELLKRVREVALGAYAHQDLSFDKLVEELQPPRDPSRNPLFQVMFILQNAPVSELTLPGITVTPLDVEQETTAFDLTLSIIETTEGIRLACRYYRDLFEPATIQRMLRHLESLLRQVVAHPEARLHTFDLRTESEIKEQAVEQLKSKQDKFAKLMTVKPKAVNLSQQQLVKSSYLHPEQPLPLVMQPAVEGVDLLAWAGANRELIDRELCKHGAILFRNFAVESIAKFEAFTRVLAPELMEYGERSSPRSKVSGAIYTSTDHPADQPIVLHNEQSYTFNWMMKLWFYCAQPALRGGATPLADSRKIFQRLEGAITAKFAEKGVMYVRNYGVGLGLPWQEVFQTDNRAEVEEYCRQAAIDWEWLDDGRLRTRQVRPAIRRHPKTGEMVWFNHALFFHVTSLEPATRDALLAGLTEADLPFNTYYGDGSSFEPEVLAAMRAAFDQETVTFPWQQGDIVMVDNMLVAHGREPYEGPRKVVVAMAEPFQSLTSEAV